MGRTDRIESSALSYLTVSSLGAGARLPSLMNLCRDQAAILDAHRANKPLSEGLTYAAQDFRAACNSSLSR